MTINVANPLALATLGMADDVAGSSAPGGTFSIVLSASKVANGAALTVTGGVTLSATATGVTVTLKRYRKSDNALLATVVNASVDFVGSVQKTWATIHGSAVTITGGTTAQEEYLVAEISGGTPAVTGETSGQVSYLVIPAFTDALTLAITISGTTASFALTNISTGVDVVKVYHRLAGERTWTLGATATMPTTTGSIASLTKSKLYEFIAVPYGDGYPGDSSNLERKWVADTSKFKAILDRVEAEIEALAWTGWATSQVTIAWSPALVKDKAMPRVAVAPGNAPDSIVAQTNTSYSVAFPVRLYLMDRVSTRDAQMEALLAKREALRQLFMQRNVLSEVDGVFNVRVEPLPVVNDPDIDERMLVTGVELAVEVEEAR